MKTKTKTIKDIKKRNKTQKREKTQKIKKCNKGKILIEQYKTKDGRIVKSHCKKDMGKPGKGKKLFTLKKGDLTKYGYSLKKNAIERIKSLNKAIIDIPKNRLIRKLNALSVLHKNTNPMYSRRARNDMKFIQDNAK